MKKPSKERIARIHEDRCWINIQVLCGSYFENVYGYRKEGYENEIAQQKKEMEEHGYRFID